MVTYPGLVTYSGLMDPQEKSEELMMDPRESTRPRQADDGQAADGQKGLSQQLFELCEEPETAGGHYVFVVADLRGAKFAYITARALSRKLLSSRTKIVKALMPGPSVAGLSH